MQQPLKYSPGVQCRLPCPQSYTANLVILGTDLGKEAAHLHCQVILSDVARREGLPQPLSAPALNIILSNV